MSGSDTHSFISSRSQVQSLDPFLFVFHINVVLLGLFGLYVALTIPRALVYLFQPSDVFNGFFLRSGLPRAFRGGDTPARSATIRSTKPMRSISTRKNQIVLTTAGTCGEDMGGGGIWQTQPSPLSPPALVVPQVAAARLSRRHVSSPRRAPTRVPRWGTIVHPTIAYALNFRVAPGFSFGKLLVLLAYATVMAYAVILRSDPFTDPVRAGYVAMSQIPIAVALAGKTNWLSWASGVSYQKLNYIHRFSGRVIVVVSNIHVLGYVYNWSLKGTLQIKFREPIFLWGLGAVAAVNLLFLSSLSYVRNRMYNLFFTLHVTCVAVILIATYEHAPITLPYILAATGLIAFDRLARLFRTRYTKAWVTAENALNGGTTLVHVPSLGAGWRAGQHVRFRVVSSSYLGWLTTWLFGRARPFTVAAGSDSGGIILSIKARGSWSRNLLRTSDADDAHYKERHTDREHGRGPSREVRVIVEGPYGSPGYTLYAAYSGAVLVAGGSGISYVMSVLDDMLQKHASGKSRLRIIEVIWTVTDPDSLYSLLPELMPLMQPRSTLHNSLSLRFNVHWTRASSHPPLVPRTALPQGMYILPGRPDIYGTLRDTISGVLDMDSKNKSRSASTPSGVVIGTCGPTSLVDDVTRAVGRVNWSDWNDVGGVESIEEVFGW